MIALKEIDAYNWIKKELYKVIVICNYERWMKNKIDIRGLFFSEPSSLHLFAIDTRCNEERLPMNLVTGTLISVKLLHSSFELTRWFQWVFPEPRLLLSKSVYIILYLHSTYVRYWLCDLDRHKFINNYFI